MSDTELLRRASERVNDELLRPVRLTMGDDTVMERTALAVLRIVGEVEQEIAGQWLTLAAAAEVSGYSYDTVQRHAKAVADDETPDAPWDQLEVRVEGRRYEVRAGSLPRKLGSAA